MVVGWGRCGRTVTQTQNFASWRAVVVESGRGTHGEHKFWLACQAHQIHHSSAGAPIFTPFASRDCQRYCVSRTLGEYFRFLGRAVKRCVKTTL